MVVYIPLGSFELLFVHSEFLFSFVFLHFELLNLFLFVRFLGEELGSVLDDAADCVDVVLGHLSDEVDGVLVLIFDVAALLVLLDHHGV